MSKAETSGPVSGERLSSGKKIVLAAVGSWALVGCGTNSTIDAEAFIKAEQLQQAIDGVPSDECRDALKEQMTSTGTFDVVGTPACSDISVGEAQAVTEARKEFSNSLPTNSNEDFTVLLGAISVAVGMVAYTVGKAVGQSRD